MRRFWAASRRDVLILSLLFFLPLVLFWQQTLGGRTLLPAENLYQYPPFAADREALGVPLPHNALLSDLVLQNMQWKAFIRASFAEGELPLWNPTQFAGVPFLAAGQQSTLYPLSVLYYVLPLWLAYGWFTVITLWMAGAFMYAFARGLGIRRSGAAIAGVTYQLAGFFTVSAVFPMIIAGAAWLPLILLMLEFIIRRRPAFRGRSSPVLWAVIGAIAVGCVLLAGHAEIVYYTLLIAGYYTAARLLIAWWKGRRSPDAQGALMLGGVVQAGGWALVMVLLGAALGAIQLVPLFELVSLNFRTGSATYDDIRTWAHPFRDLLLFLMPNFYGNPSHHAYFDLFSGQTVPVTINATGSAIRTIDWGIKNYVEGAVYLGILPLALAVYGVASRAERAKKLIFAALAFLSLTFMFGLPTYLALMLLPGINQLHSPFRWIFAFSLCVALLAGWGWDALRAQVTRSRRRILLDRILTYGLLGVGALTLIALLLSRLFYEAIDPLMNRLVEGMALASGAFADGQMFYSYQFFNVLTFGVMALASGALVWWLTHRRYRTVIALAAVVLIALDLLIAAWGFNAASDPEWLDHTPPSIAWLQGQPGDWRYTTFNDPTVAHPDLFNANLTMRYGLDDVRGYESIITRQYVDYMNRLAPQVQLEFNRIAPIYTVYPESVAFDGREALTSPWLDLLNVRYVITHPTTSLADLPEYALAYEDSSVRIWENMDYAPRAFLTAPGDQDGERIPLTLTHLNSREMTVDVTLESPADLIMLESFVPGWRAFVSAIVPGEGERIEHERPLSLVYDNFMRLSLEGGSWHVRLIYSPAEFQIGLFGTLIGVILVMLLIGGSLWQAYVVPPPDADQTTDSARLGRLARNSLAPIMLNLFNRGIDFAFAIVMLRVLGPEGSGSYTYATVVFMWFEIIANFGLSLYLTREVSRDRARAGQLLLNTSALRVALALMGIPLLLLFIGIRQTTVTPALNTETLIALGLLYVGMIPSSLSTGLTSLYYAFERAEIPAAVATVAAVCKAIFGLIALVSGAGIVGLAAVSILTNLITLSILLYYGRSMIRGSGAPRIERSLIRRMTGESWFLMLNHLLATIFFQIDIIIIEAIHGARMVGQYGVAYKWVLALNIIPSFFTQAMLPIMSQQAHTDRPALRRMYVLAIKLLFSAAIPIAIIFNFGAWSLVGLLGGAEYLPDSAIATQLMIWSIPIGWMNSLTQYVLVALDLHRRITRAFIVAVIFNITTNLIFIPTFGYAAAAITTILSELVLFIPFVMLLHGAIGQIDWFRILWKPAVSGLVMFGVMLATWNILPLLALITGGAAYAATWIGLRGFSDEEWARLLPLLPGRVRSVVSRVALRA
jgi:O-antigen/teichoic acid export membrane protein